jgi:hypothetical protein
MNSPPSGSDALKHPPQRTSLSRILGGGFGIAVIFGGTVGVGILRLPYTIAGEDCETIIPGDSKLVQERNRPDART